MITLERQNCNRDELRRAIKSSHSVCTYKGIDMVNLKALAEALLRNMEMDHRKVDFASIVIDVLDNILDKDWKEANAHSFLYRGMVGMDAISILVKKDRVFDEVNEEWMTTYTF